MSQAVPPLTIYLRRYRSAIALNNVAVRLLEHRCYEQTARTLEQAKALIDSVIRISRLQEKPNSSIPQQEDLCGEDLVNRSLKHLSDPANSSKLDGMILEVLTTATEGSLLTSEAASLDFVLSGSPSSSVAFPVRIEDYITSDWMDGDSCYLLLVQRQSSIISHNLAIAYRCLCQSIPPCPYRNRMLQFALLHAQESSFRLVQQLSFLPEAEEVLKWYCLAIASLNSLIQIQQEMGQDAVECYGAMLELRSAVLCHQEASPHELITIEPGAAAA